MGQRQLYRSDEGLLTGARERTHGVLHLAVGIGDSGTVRELNRFADADPYGSRSGELGLRRKDVRRAFHVDWEDGDALAEGENRRAGVEGEEVAGLGARALGEDEE